MPDDPSIDPVPTGPRPTSSANTRWFVVASLVGVIAVAGVSFLGVDRYLRTQVQSPSYDYTFVAGESASVSIPDSVDLKQVKLCGAGEHCVTLADEVVGVSADIVVPVDFPAGEATLRIFAYQDDGQSGGYGSGYDSGYGDEPDSGYGAGYGEDGSGYGNDEPDESGYGDGGSVPGTQLVLIQQRSVLVQAAVNAPSSSPSPSPSLEPKAAGVITTAPGAGGGPHVKVFEADTGIVRASFFAYTSGFTGGVRVAMGDVDNDGTDEIITAPGAGGGPHIRVFKQTGQLVTEFFAYDPGFTGGVYVGSGDIDGDGFDDIITAAGGGGGPHVKVFDGQTRGVIKSFFAYDSNFTGGVQVAAGDINGDGHEDIMTAPGTGGGPHVKVFDGQNGGVLKEFLAYDAGFTGGVFVGASDFNNDTVVDIMTAPGAGGGPHVKVFDGQTLGLFQEFFAYDPGFTGGVSVGTGLWSGDGVSDEPVIITGTGAGGGPHVKVFDDAGRVVREFFAYDSNFTGGVFVTGGVRVEE